MEIVLTGRSGKLGGALQRAWGSRHRVVALSRAELDLSRPDGLREGLAGRSFDALVNCAAMASPEACEADPDAAHLVNAESPGVLAALCRDRGARLVHFSTDYVLEGSSPGLKDESAPVGPVNVYGHSKLAGERSVLAAHPEALVGRVSWIFGTDPPGMIETIVQRARAGDALELVADKYSKPTSAVEIARMVEALLARPDSGGVYHLTHAGEPESWWSSGTQALALACEEGLLDGPREIARRTLAEVARLAVPRPIHTAMDPRRLREEMGWPDGSWQEAARGRCRELLG